MTRLTIIIPTHNRREVLLGSLRRMPSSLPGAVEVIVVDDGSTDGTAAAVKAEARHLPFPLSLLTQEQRGPAAARNRGLAAAEAPVVLFLGDDTRPVGDAVRRHLRFHERNGGEHHALLGKVEWAQAPAPTPFMDWLEDSGVQFGFTQVERQMRDGCVPGRFFFTSNVSAKTSFLRANGGFDERFHAAALEDTELGGRLELAGMRLAYDGDAVVEHVHPTDLVSAVARMRVVGRSRRELAARGGRVDGPRRPGLRHRAGAALLYAAAVLPIGEHRLRRETWRYLCHEAHREGFWGIDPLSPRQRLRYGDRLLTRAARDPHTALPRE